MKHWTFLLIFFPLVFLQEKELPQIGGVGESLLEDKEFLLNYFKETEDNLEEITKGLSADQLSYKTSEDRWSVSQVLEHIVLTEEAIFKMTTELMDKDPSPERRSEIKASDEDLIRGMEDRSEKVQAPEDLQPSGKYTDPEVALDELEAQREIILEFIKNTTEEDMRNHISDSPFGPIDAYQSLLFIAGHTARHTKQIEEVLADPGFPD